jgi:poly(A) polymerase
MEMLKLMVAEGAAVAVTAMADGGLLLPIFGGLAYTGPLRAMISTERMLGWKPDAIRRLGALAVAVTEDAKRVATRLRLTNAETKALDSMGHRWWRLAGMDEATARRRLYRLGAERYCDRLLLRGAPGDTDRALARACQLPRWRARNFRSRRPISSRVIEGPLLGQVLRCRDAWLAADFPWTRRAQTIADCRGAFYPRDRL